MRDENSTNTAMFFLLVAFVLLFSPAGNSHTFGASVPADDISEFLEQNAKLESSDFSKIENGEILVKSLPVEKKREAAFFGIASIRAPAQSVFSIFQENVSRLNKKFLMASNSFGDQPSLADLENLTLEDADVEALKRCRVGSCGLRLSASMIERFQTEVDWSAADYSKQATDLFRRLILQYVEDYLVRGNEALIEYGDTRKPVSLRQEQEEMLKENGWIKNHAPEFFAYLRNPQLLQPANVQKSISWAKIKFGLKPVIVIMQTITYTADKGNGRREFFSVSKQIYASRYFDSSLVLIGLIETPASEKTVRTDFLYHSRSRSNVLGGFLGKFVRKIVEREIIEKLEHLLRRTKSRAEYSSNSEDTTAPLNRQPNTGWLNGQNYLVGVLILIGALFAIKCAVKRKLFDKTFLSKTP